MTPIDPGFESDFTSMWGKMMLRFAALVVLAATAAAQPAAGQTINVPRQSAPVVVAPQARAPAVRAVPQINPLTTIQRAQVVQQLTGVATSVGQTIVLTPNAAVAAGGASFRFNNPVSVDFAQGSARFAGNTAVRWGSQLLRIDFPNWPAGQILVDCSVISPSPGTQFYWRHLGSSAEGTVPLTNNHLLFVVLTSAPSQGIDITNNGTYWDLTRCELTRLG